MLTSSVLDIKISPNTCSGHQFWKLLQASMAGIPYYSLSFPHVLGKEWAPLFLLTKQPFFLAESRNKLLFSLAAAPFACGWEGGGGRNTRKKKGKRLEITSLFCSARISKVSVIVSGKEWRHYLAELMIQRRTGRRYSSHGFQNQWSMQMPRGLFPCGSSRSSFMK